MSTHLEGFETHGLPLYVPSTDVKYYNSTCVFELNKYHRE